MEITALSRAPSRAVNESAARASDIALQQSSGRATEKLITTDLWPHGLTAQGRVMRACALPSCVDARGRAIGATVADLIEQEWITALKQRSGRAEIAVAVNGRPIPRAVWRETPLKGGEIVTLRAALADGGGDKNPLRTILQIGVLVAAIVVPPLLFTATWAQTLAGRRHHHRRRAHRQRHRPADPARCRPPARRRAHLQPQRRRQPRARL